MIKQRDMKRKRSGKSHNHIKLSKCVVSFKILLQKVVPPFFNAGSSSSTSLKSSCFGNPEKSCAFTQYFALTIFTQTAKINERTTSHFTQNEFGLWNFELEEKKSIGELVL